VSKQKKEPKNNYSNSFAFFLKLLGIQTEGLAKPRFVSKKKKKNPDLIIIQNKTGTPENLCRTFAQRNQSGLSFTQELTTKKIIK
jgi:hypothetical protein